MHLIPNPRAYQALDGAFTLQDGEKVKSELRIPFGAHHHPGGTDHCHPQPRRCKRKHIP